MSMQHSTIHAQPHQMLDQKSQKSLMTDSTKVFAGACNSGNTIQVPQEQYYSRLVTDVAVHLPRIHCKNGSIWSNLNGNLKTRSHWPICTVIKLLFLNKSHYTTAHLLQLKHSNPSCSRLLKVCLNIHWTNRTQTSYSSYRHSATVPSPTTPSCRMNKTQEFQKCNVIALLLVSACSTWN